MSALEPSELTPSEALLVWRRRRGYSQIEAAEHFGVSRSLYSRWERGQCEDTDCPDVRVSTALSAAEQCLILRRRRGWRQADLARALGVSRYWAGEIERGANPELAPEAVECLRRPGR